MINVRGDRFFLEHPNFSDEDHDSEIFQRINLWEPLAVGVLKDYSTRLKELKATEVLTELQGSTTNGKLTFIKYTSTELQPNMFYYVYKDSDYDTLPKSLYYSGRGTHQLDGLGPYLTKTLGQEQAHLSMSFDKIYLVCSEYESVKILGTLLDRDYIKSIGLYGPGSINLVEPSSQNTYIPIYYSIPAEVEAVMVQYMKSIPKTRLIDGLVVKDLRSVAPSDYQHLATVLVRQVYSFEGLPVLSPRLVSIMRHKNNGLFLIADPKPVLKTFPMPNQTKLLSSIVMLAPTPAYMGNDLTVAIPIASNKVNVGVVSMLVKHEDSIRTKSFQDEVLLPSDRNPMDYYSQRPVPSMVSAYAQLGNSTLQDHPTAWAEKLNLPSNIPVLSHGVNSRNYGCFVGPITDAKAMRDIPGIYQNTNDRVCFVEPATQADRSYLSEALGHKSEDIQAVMNKHYGVNFLDHSSSISVNKIGALVLNLTDECEVPAYYTNLIHEPEVVDIRNYENYPRRTVKALSRSRGLYDLNVRHKLNAFCKKTGYDTVYVIVPYCAIAAEKDYSNSELEEVALPLHHISTLKLDALKTLLQDSRVLRGKKVRITFARRLGYYKMWYDSSENIIIRALYLHAYNYDVKIESITELLEYGLEIKVTHTFNELNLPAPILRRYREMVMETIPIAEEYDAMFQLLKFKGELEAAGFYIM